MKILVYEHQIFYFIFINYRIFIKNFEVAPQDGHFDVMCKGGLYVKFPTMRFPKILSLVKF